MSAKAEGKKSHYVVHFIIMIAFMFLFRFIPAPAPITPYGMQVIGIFIGMLYGWTATNDLIAPSILAFAAMATTAFGGGNEVLAGVFSNSSVMMILFGSLLIGPISSSGVGEYFMLRFLSAKFVAGKPWRLTAFLLVGLYLVDVITSNPMIVVLLVLAIFPGTLSEIGYTDKDKYPNMLIMGIVIGALMSCIIFPFMSIGLLPTGALKAATGLSINSGGWIITLFVFSIIYLLGFTLLMKLMGCDASKMKAFSIETFHEKFPNGMSKYQKAVTFSVVLMLVGSKLFHLQVFLVRSVDIFHGLVLLVG